MLVNGEILIHGALDDRSHDCLRLLSNERIVILRIFLKETIKREWHMDNFTVHGRLLSACNLLHRRIFFRSKFSSHISNLVHSLVV